MINPGSRRGSNSSSRKTVSFDILTNCGDESSAAASNRFNNNTSHYYSYHSARNEAGDEKDGVRKRHWMDNGNVQSDCSGREKPEEESAAAKAPNESIFKFCKVKSIVGSNNNSSNNDRTRHSNNNDADDVEHDGSGERADDIDGYVRQSHVKAIRDYVTRNYFCAEHENVPQSNNNNNAYVNGVEDGESGDDDEDNDDDHCKLIRNIRLLKESSFGGKASGKAADKPRFYRSDSENVNISTPKGNLSRDESCFITEFH